MKQNLMRWLGLSQNAPRGSKLRPNDLTPLEQEFLPPLLEIQESPPSPTKQKVVLSIVALVFLLLLWSWLGKIDVVTTAPGKFIPDGKVKAIQSLDSAIVRNIYVQEGQRVKKGDVLMQLDATSSGADLEAYQKKLALSQLEQERLQAELDQRTPHYAQDWADPQLIALQEQLRQARRATHTARLEQARQALREKQAQFTSAQAVLRKLQELNPVLREKEENARPLVQSGALSRVDYLQIKQDLISNERDLQAQISTVEQYEHACAEAEHKIQEVERDDQASILTDLDTHAGVISENQSNVIKSRRQVEQRRLTSPVDGIVQSIAVSTIGGVVTPSEPLIVIVPNDTPLIVEATLSNEEVGFVQPGQRVDIKVDSFPFQKYGSLAGTLTWVSPDAEETQLATNTPDAGSLKSGQGNSAGSGHGKISYRIHVKPDNQFLFNHNQRLAMAPGMTVEADIITNRRRIIDFFLSPINKYLQDGMKVR